MPMVDTGMGDLAQQMLALAQIMGKRKDQQAQNLLALALPGQTVAEAMPPDMARRALGRNFDPNKVIKPETADDVADAAEKNFLKLAGTPEGQKLLDQAQPGDIVSLGASITANKRLGMQGATTPAGIKAAAKTTATKAETAVITSGSVLDLVKQGTEAFKNAPAATRAAAGQKLAIGQTAESIGLEQLQTAMNAEMTKEAIKFAANPNAHPWGKQLRGLGVDPTAAMAAAGTGMLSLMGNVAQMTVDAAQGRIQMSVASANRQAAMAVEQSKLDNAWADRMSQSLGGKLPPSAILGVLRTPRSEIKDKKQLEAYDAAAGLINQGSEAAYNVIVADAFQKGNPEVQALKGLMDAAKIKDTKTAEAFGVAIRQQAGKLAATQLLGPRPTDEKTAALWDAAASQYMDFAPKEPSFWDNLGARFGAQVREAVGASPQGSMTQGIPNSMVPQNPMQQAPAPMATPQAQVPSMKDLSPEDQAAINLFMQVFQPPPQQPPQQP